MVSIIFSPPRFDTSRPIDGFPDNRAIESWSLKVRLTDATSRIVTTASLLTLIGWSRI